MKFPVRPTYTITIGLETACVGASDLDSDVDIGVLPLPDCPFDMLSSNNQDGMAKLDAQSGSSKVRGSWSQCVPLMSPERLEETTLIWQR